MRLFRLWLRDHPRFQILAGLYAGGVAVAESFAFGAVTGDGNDWEIFVAMHAVMFIAVAGTLLAFRVCGFRLVRGTPAE